MTTRSASRPSRPWVGLSYAHVVLPVPHLDDELRQRFSAGLAADGWEPVPDDEARARGLDAPVLMHRWRHASASTLIAVVLAWYPLVITFGSDGQANAKTRKAIRRIVEVTLDANGRELPDADLDRVLETVGERWRKALDARHTIEEQRKWLECRQCQTCGEWSAYGVLHCSGCARRFAPADDADREERGRRAAEATAEAERTLTSLGRGEGLFIDWPTGPATQPPAPTEDSA